MALSGIQIFKHLPKTNCKDCGFPTCLAFAMKLAQKQVSLDACVHVSEEAKAILGAASEPPVRKITVGCGERAVSVGEETVLFRHEKKFVNQCGFALNIDDTLSEAEIGEKVKSVLDSPIDRVGQKLGVEIISVYNRSGDADKFASAVQRIAAMNSEIPLIINSKNPSAIREALKHCAGKKPALYAATEDNYEEMTAIAKESSANLVVRADGFDALSALTEKILALGHKDLLLDSSASSLSKLIEQNTIIRRAAVKKSFKPLGFPIITYSFPVENTSDYDKYDEITSASVAISKYSSIIVLSNIDKARMLSLITLRQNIYTDPQVPMQVAQNVYKIGTPDNTSPILITTNFSLTYFIVQGEVENSKISCWLLIMDVEGLSVLTAWSAGKFISSKIAAFVKESGIEDMTTKRELTIPGYVSILSGSLEAKLGDDWQVVVGPREANALPPYLKGLSK